MDEFTTALETNDLPGSFVAAPITFKEWTFLTPSNLNSFTNSDTSDSGKRANVITPETHLQNDLKSYMQQYLQGPSSQATAEQVSSFSSERLKISKISRGLFDFSPKSEGGADICSFKEWMRKKGLAEGKVLIEERLKGVEHYVLYLQETGGEEVAQRFRQVRAEWIQLERQAYEALK